MYNAKEKARIKWACRRGMLELDVLIMPFFEECFENLENDEKRNFISLLQCADPDLFTWIVRYDRSKNCSYASIVDKIVKYNLSKIP
ncbi:succinate dehydrogenase assembly factor 2 [Candidatus Photodesmus blepharus]|nr:succinate dehydrogenase assembly factor 2 [Candidatus Photodesmus blepharus]